MIRVTAATSFHGNEGMWRAGDTKEVSNHRAHELIENGLVIEAGSQEGVTLDETEDETPANEKPVTSTIGKRKPKPKPFEDRETKDEQPADNTK